MFFLISNGAIVGTTDQADNLPEGYSAVEGVDLPIDLIYFEDGQILEKPDRPSPTHFWDEENNEWITQTLEPLPQGENWNALLAEMRGSLFFAKCFNAAERTLKANAAWTLLYGTLTRTNDLNDLMFSLIKMREAMSGIAAIGDFTIAEIDQINQILTQSGFEFQLELGES